MKSLIYLLAGLALGLLIAPETGADMRKKIAEGFSDAKEDAEDFTSENADKLKASLAEA